MRQSSSDPWQLLKQGVSLRTTLLAFVPIVLWILFVVVFVYAFRAVVRVTGPVGTVMLVVRSSVELGSAMIAFKYFFDILVRGAEREQSIDRERRA